ncbi:hypothetical protein D3C72_2277290 [compost metagenome]
MAGYTGHRILGTCYRICLADRRLYDGYLYRCTGRNSEGSDRSGQNRRRPRTAAVPKRLCPFDHASYNDLPVPDHLQRIQNVRPQPVADQGRTGNLHPVAGL